VSGHLTIAYGRASHNIPCFQARAIALQSFRPRTDEAIAGRSGATGRAAKQDCYQPCGTLCRGTSFAIPSPYLESALAGRASAIIRRLGLFFSSSRVEFGAFYDVALSAFVSLLPRQ
jgi:hypothetical protein